MWGFLSTWHLIKWQNLTGLQVSDNKGFLSNMSYSNVKFQIYLPLRGLHAGFPLGQIFSTVCRVLWWSQYTVNVIHSFFCFFLFTCRWIGSWENGFRYSVWGLCSQKRSSHPVQSPEQMCLLRAMPPSFHAMRSSTITFNVTQLSSSLHKCYSCQQVTICKKKKPGYHCCQWVFLFFFSQFILAAKKKMRRKLQIIFQ